MKKLIAFLSVAAAAMLTLCSCAPEGTGTNGANNANGGMSMWVIILLYVAIFAAIYFFMIRPNSKRKKQEQAMRDNLEIGDEITTIGGIMGKVVSIKEETDSFVIETGADRVKMQFKRWALSSVDTIKEDPNKPEETKSKGRFGRSKDEKKSK